jgi:hypothetical protein
MGSYILLLIHNRQGPATWTTLADALICAEKYHYSGIGFMFTAESGIVGIDIDHCLENGKPNEIAANILAHLPPTYIEISPSGTGLHIFLRGTLPSGGNRNSKNGVEMYAASRYFTMTGNKYQGSVDNIAADDGALDYIHSKYVAQSRKAKAKSTNQSGGALTDDALLKLAQTSKDGTAFEALWRGDWQGEFPSQSEADYSLCRKLAFWTAREEAQMDRLFRQSGLYREKWDSRHSAGGATYGETTIKNACKAAGQIYTPPEQKKEPEIFAQGGAYYRRKGDKTNKITNFIVEPIEMILSEDEAQINCNFVTESGERFRQNLVSSVMGSLRTFKNILSKKAIALSFFGSEGDLDLFKIHIYNNLDWLKKRGVKALGIYPLKKKLVFVDPTARWALAARRSMTSSNLRNIAALRAIFCLRP